MQAAEPTTTPTWRWAATGTTWQIHHSGGVSADTARVVAEAVERDEARWSRFRASSVVSRINRRAGIAVEVDPDTLHLLTACQTWVVQTGGVFQPLVGAVLESWGYRSSIFEHLPGTDRSPEPHPVTGALEVDRAAGTVRIPADTRLDLGGIAKAWMAQRAAKLIADMSDDEAILVDAGGDLACVRGDHRVAVERPGVQPANVPGVAAGETAVWVSVAEGEGIATSGCGRRRWVNGDGAVAHHLIDPADGRPGPAAHATVMGPDVVMADVMAKTLALRPALIADTALAAMVTAGTRTLTTPSWDRRVAR